MVDGVFFFDDDNEEVVVVEVLDVEDETVAFAFVLAFALDFIFLNF